jgi:hypothetical protein
MKDKAIPGCDCEPITYHLSLEAHAKFSCPQISNIDLWA